MAPYERSSQSAANPGTFPQVNPGLAMQSAAHTMMRGNMELMGLMSRRARAHLEFPRQAMTCRNPAEFGQLGAQFWHSAFTDYVSYNQRLMGLWVQGMSAVGQGAVAREAAEFAGRMSAPMTEAAENAVDQMETADPAEPWAWWRTDMKGLKPHRNGHHSEEDRGARS